MGVVPAVTKAAKRAQSGYLFRYASVMIAGLAIIVTWFLAGGFS